LNDSQSYEDWENDRHADESRRRKSQMPDWLAEFNRQQALPSIIDALVSEPDEKTARNRRVQARYDELMRQGKHGHYETMFRVVHEEVDRAQTEAYAEGRKDEAEAEKAAVAEGYDCKDCPATHVICADMDCCQRWA
jgi:hypothetical protein